MARWIEQLSLRFRYWANRRQMEADLREEMETHLAMLEQDGGPHVARRRLGNATRWQEISRETWGGSWLESLGRDIRHGGRLLRKSPGFSVTACLSLAIGMGATLGVFSLMNALLFKTLPVPHPEQLWELGHNNPDERDDSFSYRVYEGLQKANRTGIPLFAFGGDYVQVTYSDSVRNTPALMVSGDAFRLLGLHAHIGRLLTRDDDVRGVPHGANCVLSYRLWQSQFHGDPAVVGKHIYIGVQPFTIVGVAPADFFGFYVGAFSDLILPIAAYAATNPAQPILENGGWTWLNVMARVPPGFPVRDLIAEVNINYPYVRKQINPSTFEAAKRDKLYAISTATGVSAVRGRFSQALFVLLTMTGLILLIACANLANLLLARSVGRYREMAIRLSLGAHRTRIVRQLLTESALLGVLGCCAGIPVYIACTSGLVAFVGSRPGSNIFLDTRPDWRLLLAVIGLLSMTVLLFGFLPALRAIRSDMNSALTETSQRIAARTTFGKAIVGVQISLAMVLLVGATLLARSLFDLRTFDAGFRRDHILIAAVDTSQMIHKNADLIRFFDRLLPRVESIAGVRSAAASIVAPLTGSSWQQDYDIAGKADAGQSGFHSYENWVTTRYLETLGTPLLLGRGFDRADSSTSNHVAMVNETFARRAFGSSDPIGRIVTVQKNKEPLTIIGVVGDARYLTLKADVPPTLYRPVAQLPPSFQFLLTLNLEVWTSSAAGDVRKPIEQLLRSLDGNPTADFNTFDSLIDSDLLYERLLTALSVGFGVIALFLTVVGVYGLCSYSVARRVPEVGIRMALGATPGRIVSMILGDQIRMLGIAIAAGLGLSMVLTRFLRAWLFGVSATDPVLYAVAVIVLIALALLAAFAPARRAARLNPVTALRSE